MHLRILLAIPITLMFLSGASAQYGRPVEAIPARPPVAVPVPATPLPNTNGATNLPSLPVPATPTITSPPAAVPIPPTPTPKAAQTRPRRCWCYRVNPAKGSRERTTCGTDCCKGNERDERC